MKVQNWKMVWYPRTPFCVEDRNTSEFTKPFACSPLRRPATAWLPKPLLRSLFSLCQSRHGRASNASLFASFDPLCSHHNPPSAPTPYPQKTLLVGDCVAAVLPPTLLEHSTLTPICTTKPPPPPPTPPPPTHPRHASTKRNQVRAFFGLEPLVYVVFRSLVPLALVPLVGVSVLVAFGTWRPFLCPPPPPCFSAPLALFPLFSRFRPWVPWALALCISAVFCPFFSLPTPVHFLSLWRFPCGALWCWLWCIGAACVGRTVLVLAVQLWCQMCLFWCLLGCGCCFGVLLC